MKLQSYNQTVFLLLGLLAGALTASAQLRSPWEPFSRKEKMEFYGVGQYLHSDAIKFDGPRGEVKMEMDDTGLGGFGGAFHFNDYLSLRGEFMFGGATFQTEGPGGSPLSLAHDAFLQTGRVNLDYNIINRRLTPYVTAGIGYQYLEAELERHPGVPVCWWDPWYGYVCTVEDPYVSETDFTWNVGAGVRWNITDNLFLKLGAGAQWLEYEGAKGITTQIEAHVWLGWTF